ncbi:uncharacterized protein LOC116806497 isoform X2 [Drosophila grimshawi]|uniref:uncharacterized protein LOC116806497 isoform X2 n=1 Tax=Drosophila grimshawi TaxID=7222 RepID=UPI000C870665|nr:uncharacterized protein LOC116806497 isoform X2 [Drosophila grimshawi]
MIHPPRACDILEEPRFIATLSYLNFLRYLKRRHPRLGLRRLLQEAAAQWNTLTIGKKNLFQKQRILARIARFSTVRRRLVMQHNKRGPRRQCLVEDAESRQYTRIKKPIGNIT